jgi:hypothetical protein
MLPKKYKLVYFSPFSFTIYGKIETVWLTNELDVVVQEISDTSMDFRVPVVVPHFGTVPYFGTETLSSPQPLNSHPRQNHSNSSTHPEEKMLRRRLPEGLPAVLTEFLGPVEIHSSHAGPEFDTPQTEKIYIFYGKGATKSSGSRWSEGCPSFVSAF